MQLPVLALIIALTRAALGDTQCGNTLYSSSDVDAASDAACQYVRDEETAGSSTYPHRYNNFEGFRFRDFAGPFYEFPLLPSGRLYRGGRPGPDRVVITEDCEQAGQITHSGAGGNSFIGCSGTD
ncbi:hypothetical protein L249_1220 [Ophiocordyceps polyrhachis-furcata BCC 54312]|uniref:ribonuclease T1 n=1 Tax=Ophiocordyceps polyrhachis-furcata BCC 54312 TaxID=1330021 RepID=A0A367LG42_9HYPO|nr:hypothetical protein L249_1220 [Ophiocordyceps polyrhachis-furcata BCC 54312]